MQLTFTGDIDHEVLRQELVKALGPSGWYLNGSSGSVTFIRTDDNILDPTSIIESHISSSKARAQEEVWLKIKDKREEIKKGGIKVGDYWFHSDPDSRIQQLGLVALGSSIPTGTKWKTMSGEFVDMTPQLAGQIFQAVASSDITIFKVAEDHKAAMKLVDDPRTYDFSTNWPPVYQN